MEQLSLFKENKYHLDEKNLLHCMQLQEAIETHFKIGRLRTSRYRIVAFHLKDKGKFIARIAGSFYFCELDNEEIKWKRSFHGNGDQMYKWVEWVEGEHNEKVDLLLLWCPGSDLRETYEKKKRYLEDKINADFE